MPWLNKINFNIKKINLKTPNLQQHEPTTAINNQPQRRHYILCSRYIYSPLSLLLTFNVY